MRRTLLVLLPLVVSCERCDKAGERCDPTASTVSPAGNWSIEGSGQRTGCAARQYNGEFELGPSIKLAVEAFYVTPDGGLKDSAAGDGRAIGDGTTSDVTGPPDQSFLLDSLPDGPLLDAASPDQSLVREGGGLEGGSREAGVGGDGRREAGTLGDGFPGSDGISTDGALADGTGPGDGGSKPDTRRKPDARVPGRTMQIRLKNPLQNFSLTGTVQGRCVTFETLEELPGIGTLGYFFSGEIDVAGRQIKGSFSGTGPTGCTAAGDFTITIN